MSYLKGKSVLITGGTGSFGKAFVQRLLKDDEINRLGPITFNKYDNGLYFYSSKGF